ncbi:MAG: purine-binding chemotaxis protein CheW [Calditrichaeota bacterium]|nr:purine-binding chemotaxis protein CheW [Calditrichota bacterium]MCB0266948.1 purine-binding chemotaxis protein CheW [Calditrichota bacterium]
MEDARNISEVEEIEDTQEGQFLTFTLARQEYGIEIRHVTEIIGIQRITDLPDMPAYIKGVINLRGKVIPVVDVRLRFGMENRKYDERTCIIVVNFNDAAVGLVVDTVSEVMNIPAHNIEPSPKASLKSSGGRFIKGLGKVEDDVKILLDIEQLLFDEALAEMSAS